MNAVKEQKPKNNEDTYDSMLKFECDIQDAQDYLSSILGLLENGKFNQIIHDGYADKLHSLHEITSQCLSLAKLELSENTVE